MFAALALLASAPACRPDGGGETDTADSSTEGTPGTEGTEGTAATVATNGESGEEPTAGGETTGDDDEAAASQPRVRRLSNHELGNTIEALTGLRPAALQQLPPDQRTWVFDRIAASQTVSPVHLDAFMAVARDIHRGLLAERRFDDLASACTDELMPPAVANTHQRVAGVALNLEPDWASCPTNCLIGDPIADDAAYLLYANPNSGAATHNFAAPADGRYRLTFQIQTGAATTATLFIDQQEVESFPVNSNGNSPIELSTTQTLTAGAHDLRYQFSDNNSAIHVLSLTIDGPLDEVDAPAPRRACAEALVDQLGPRAYRRPLAAEERARLIGVYDEGIADGSFHDATRMLFEAIFGSPYFLHLVEVGAPVDGRPGWYRLGEWELASRLSYALCEMPPDAALRTAAAAGELSDPSQLQAHARRLLDEPCGRETVARFYRQWLRLEQLVGLARDPEIYPEFVAATMPAAMLREADRFFTELIFNEEATLADLYDADHTWVDAVAASLYGLAVSGDQQVRVDLPPERRGFLTLPGLLTVTSKFTQTSPVHRGAFVIRDLLCGKLANPPDDFDITPPAFDPSLTTRERWAAHSADPACSSCHVRIDPVGFALEEFDAMGRHRTTENGKPVDAAGGLPDLGVADGELVGGAELAEVIAGSDEAAACFARQWFRFAGGRLEQAGTVDDETLALIRGQDGDPNTIRQSLLAHVESEAFGFRVAPEETNND